MSVFELLSTLVSLGALCVFVYYFVSLVAHVTELLTLPRE
jgi:hypothetical protein